jgi:hypothetical protein
VLWIAVLGAFVACGAWAGWRLRNAPHLGLKIPARPTMAPADPFDELLVDAPVAEGVEVVA